MNKVKAYLLDRLQEKSTWLGLITMISALGVTVSPDQAQTIATAAVALAGALVAVTKG